MWSRTVWGVAVAFSLVFLQLVEASSPSKPSIPSSLDKATTGTTYHTAATKKKTNNAPIDYTTIPWEELNEWLSQLNGNPHVQHAFLPERGITRYKVLDELERRFLNKEEEIDQVMNLKLTVEDLDELAVTNPDAFLEIKQREMESYNNHGSNTNTGVTRNKKKAKTKPKQKDPQAEHISSLKPLKEQDERADTTTPTNKTSAADDCHDDASITPQTNHNSTVDDSQGRCVVLSVNQISSIANVSLEDDVLCFGRDWKLYQNDHGYTHFEELLIYQPRGWRTFAREYMLRYHGNIDTDITREAQPRIAFRRRTFVPQAHRKCFNCGSPFHLVPDCDNPLNETVIAENKKAFFARREHHAHRRCFNCGSPCHLVSDCDNPLNQTAISINKKDFLLKKQGASSTVDQEGDLQRESLLAWLVVQDPSKRVARVNIDGGEQDVPVTMKTPTSVVLFHPDIPRCQRYNPLNFLLAYGAKNPLPDVFAELHAQNKSDTVDRLLAELSPLDYFFDFQQSVQSYKLDMLRSIGAKTSFPRLCFIKELDFRDIVGQRMAKQIVRSEVVRFIWDRITETKSSHSKQRPLSLIFAGASGVGKTELAILLATLMNKPGMEGKPASDCFLKVDCGKLSHASEVFGLSGSYQGAEEGSSLNNFILRKSRDKGSLGIVLLDEIEKANQDVIHAFYQVLDKGEWTNKRLQSGNGAQTEVISCSNIIFILTTNAAMDVIEDFARHASVLYTAEDVQEAESKQRELEALIRYKLQTTYPFTDAFIARVDRIVPFVPLSRRVGDPEDHPLLCEAMTVAKILIEKEQEKLRDDTNLQVVQSISSENKHTMAKLVVLESIEEAGVRSLQKNIATKMGHQMKHALLLEDGGIESGSRVRYSADEEARRVDWRLASKLGGRGSEQK
ncbi:Caseinolytic peptidase B protein homolog [Seminavis robusta]|uniref:Caseinolytic peptidase B protein homolog n=1 Tax=Seminavis robusta TaxID=568900 RepID=A0A9N8DEB7_9STRA|nr:Caseinolytic peptidase B protein homolog [Seminavis robusta]|eukprot:Sro115_g056850.1 Caseinolytic peptidase B protein homolog (903) ;mRNA; f:86164-88984